MNEVLASVSVGECPYCGETIDAGVAAYRWRSGTDEAAHVACHDQERAAHRQNLHNPRLVEATAKAQAMTLQDFRKLRPWVRDRYSILFIDHQPPAVLRSL